MATRQEVTALLEYITEVFPLFQLGTKTLEVWAEQLAPFSAQQLKRGVDHWIQTSGSPYAPELPQMLQAIRESTPRPERALRRGLPAPEVTHEEGLRILRSLLDQKIPGWRK